jgi:basic amino acid/polyamine antiporter, APA family
MPLTPSPQSPARVSGFTAGCVLVSNVIGGGIFTTTGFMARDLGDPWLILLLWGLGAVFALAGALSYSELAAAFPRVGGEYVYISEAYGALLGYLSGWASFTVGFGAAVAAAAVSFAVYLLQVVPWSRSDLAVEVIALVLIWSLTAVHLAGVGAGGLLQRLLTITKTGSVLLLVFGALLFGHGSWTHFAGTASATSSAGAVAVAFIFVLYAYSGWNAIGYIAGEIVDPARTIPIALLWGTLFVGMVYVLLNVVYVYALPLDILAQPPLLPVAEKSSAALFGPSAARLVTGLLCVSIAAAVSAMIWAGPRVYYAMAKDGRFPGFLAKAEQGAPRSAILLQGGWATFLIFSGTFEQLIVYAGVVLGTFSALAVGAVMVLRLRRPNLPRPYRVPFYPVTPALYVMAALTIVLHAAVERPTEAAYATLTILAGMPFYFLTRDRPDRATP